VLFDTLSKARIESVFLFATDGFEPYQWAAARLMRSICIYGQVIKERRNNRVAQIERRLLIGNASQLNDVLLHSEDSETLNTSFVERLNLTIRQGSSYLSRRTICYARYNEYLEDQVALLQCYYNFIRPHQALKFGQEVRTPAMQAGLTTRRLSFRDVFTARIVLFLYLFFWIKARCGFTRFQHSHRRFATVP